MKKFLSLALALVMTMSLVTISAGATFTDDSTIEYLDAVEVMTALDIVGGYADGSFNPDGTLTRGAAAKIICNLILGPTIASDLGTTTDPFPDVAYNHTFAGYIAWCANQGIINGYEDGTFRPAGTITGYAFMKMLLGALGYDADVEGYTGTNWAVNVAAKAKTIGLYDGNEDYVGSQALTREEACLYALNTMTSAVVEYDSKSSVTVGDIVISNNSKAETVDKDDDKNADTFMETYFSKLDKTTAGVTDEFGRAATKWTYKGDEVGVYASGDGLEASYTGSVSKGTLYSLIGSDLYDAFVATAADNTADETTLKVIVDGKTTELKGTDAAKFFIKNSSSAATYTGNSVETEVYVNETEYADDTDTEITIVVINTYVVKAADDYDADDEELEIDVLDVADIDDVISNDDINVEAFEKGDYILITVGENAKDKAVIMSAELAETLTGAVTTYTNNASVTVDGTKYVYNKTVADKSTGFEIGEDTVLVLDQYGNVIYVDEATTAVDGVVYVEDFGSIKDAYTGYTYYAKLYFADGTYVNAQLDKINGNDADGKDAANIWYSYTENDDGTYDLKDVEDYTNAAAATGATLVNGKINFAVDKDLKGNSSTVFVVKDTDGDLFVYTGIANLPKTATGTADVYALNDGSYASYVFIDAAKATMAGATSDITDYALVLEVGKNVIKTADKVDVYEIEVLIDGEVVTMYQHDDAGMVAGKVYDTLVLDEYGNIESAKYYTDTVDGTEVEKDLIAYQASKSGEILNVAGTPYIFGDDTVVYVYATEDTDLADSENDYGFYTFTSISSLVNKLDDYTIDGVAAIIKTADDSEEIAAMYITIGDSFDIDDAAAVNVATGRPGEASGGTYATAYSDAGVVITGTDITVTKDTFKDGKTDTMKHGDTYVVGLAFAAPAGTDSAVVIGKSPVLSVDDINEFIKVDDVYYLMAYVTVATIDGETVTMTAQDYTDTIAWYNAAGELISVSNADITVTIK